VVNNGKHWKHKKKEKFLKLANDDKQRATRDRQNYIKTHPKRPMSGYMLFCQEFRKEIKEKEPNLSLTEVSVKAGHKWKQLSDAEKKKFQDQAASNLENWKQRQQQQQQ